MTKGWILKGHTTIVNMLFLLDVQSLSHVPFLAIPWIAACQAPLSSTTSQSLLKLMFTESVMLSNHLNLCCPLLLLPSVFPSIRVFSNESLHISCQSIRASATVLSMNTQGWFCLALTGLISLQSKGLSRVFSRITVLSFLWSSTFFMVHEYWKNHSFDYTDFCQQCDISAF